MIYRNKQKVRCRRGICKEIDSIKAKMENLYSEKDIVNEIEKDLMDDIFQDQR